MDRHLFLKYIDFITSFLKRNYVDKLISIILFGSLVNKEEKLTTSTDVDLLIITRDSCPSTDFQNIRQDLFNLEYRFFSHLSNHETLFVKCLQNATGMFCNFFICRFSDFKNRNFHRVFGVSSVMGTLLAPRNSVWLSLLQQHRVIWGENVFKEWKTIPNMTRGDLIRSLLMNWLLATGALLLCPFYTQMTKFSMEAMKWSLFTWKNSYHPKKTLTQTIARYIKRASIVERRALQCFMEFRKNKKISKHFCFLAFFFVILLHKSLVRRSYG